MKDIARRRTNANRTGPPRSTPETTSTLVARAASEASNASLRTDDRAPDAHIGRRSTSYIDWPSLMLRSYDIDVLQCPTCDGGRMRVIAAITDHDIIEKILTHLRLPLEPEILSDGYTVAYDITGQPLIDSDLGQNEEQRQRGPPMD
jgi:hypothetical protein